MRNQAAVSESPVQTVNGGRQSNSRLIFDESIRSEPTSRSITACFPATIPIQRSIGVGIDHSRTLTPMPLPSRRINSGVERSSPSLTI